MPEPVRAIAEAMWKVSQGYTVEDWGDRGPVDWSPLNANDVADQALHMEHAERVLQHLLAAGWTPPADDWAHECQETRCDQPGCSESRERCCPHCSGWRLRERSDDA